MVLAGEIDLAGGAQAFLLPVFVSGHDATDFEAGKLYDQKRGHSAFIEDRAGEKGGWFFEVRAVGLEVGELVVAPVHGTEGVGEEFSEVGIRVGAVFQVGGELDGLLEAVDNVAGFGVDDHHIFEAESFGVTRDHGLYRGVDSGVGGAVVAGDEGLFLFVGVWVAGDVLVLEVAAGGEGGEVAVENGIALGDSVEGGQEGIGVEGGQPLIDFGGDGDGLKLGVGGTQLGGDFEEVSALGHGDDLGTEAAEVAGELVGLGIPDAGELAVGALSECPAAEVVAEVGDRQDRPQGDNEHHQDELRLNPQTVQLPDPRLTARLRATRSVTLSTQFDKYTRGAVIVKPRGIGIRIRIRPNCPPCLRVRRFAAGLDLPVGDDGDPLPGCRSSLRTAQICCGERPSSGMFLLLEAEARYIPRSSAWRSLPHCRRVTPPMLYWIYDIPTWQLGVMVGLLFVGIMWFGAVFVRPFLRLLLRNQPGLNDLVGYVLGCYCMFYGLLLGLIAVAAYQNQADVEKTVAEESAALTSLFRDISHYPQPYKGDLQVQLRDYTKYVLSGEWAENRRGRIPQQSTDLLVLFQDRLLEFEPETMGQQVLHAETLREFSNYIHVRRIRRHNVTAGIPAVMWAVVIMGAIVNIVMIWMFEMKLILQLFLGGILAFFIGTVIFLIAAMDNPFRGELGVAPDAIQAVYEKLMVPSIGRAGG